MKKKEEERKNWCLVDSFLPVGAGLQETLAAAEGTQDLASPHIHSAERTADMTCVFETQWVEV